MSFLVRTPFATHVLPLSEVPDPIFTSGVVGDGRTLLPGADYTCVTTHSPIGGVVTKFKSHAVIITSTRGLSIFIYLGINTVGLRGRDFAPLAEEKDIIDTGVLLIHQDLGPVRAADLSPCVPVVVVSLSGKSVSPEFDETSPTMRILDPLFSLSNGDWTSTVYMSPTTFSGHGAHLFSISESVSGRSRAAA